MNKFAISTSVAALFLVGAINCHGSLIVTATEVAGDVVFSGGGSADLTGLVLDSTPAVGAGSIANFPKFIMADGADGASWVFGITSGPSDYGTGSTMFASSFSGDLFGIFSSSQIIVPSDYVSGTDLSGTMTLGGTTFASAGMTPGTYMWTWGSDGIADSFTLQIGATVPVPAPATLVLLGLGLAGLGWSRRTKS
jgi:hypothetical protein